MGQINIAMFYSQVRKASLKSLKNLPELGCAPTGTGAQISGVNSKAPALVCYSLGFVYFEQCPWKRQTFGGENVGMLATDGSHLRSSLSPQRPRGTSPHPSNGFI